jgi:hypothetical protein
VVVRSKPVSGVSGLTRLHRAHRARAWRLFCCGIALSVAASGSIEGPLLFAQVESAIDCLEAEEVVTEERRRQARRRRLADHRAVAPSASAQVAPTDVEPGLAAYVSATVARETGRLLRYRHQSLLI